MRRHGLVLILPSLAFFTGAALAQQTIVVDALNRPGTNFTDIPPAVQAAMPGDTILVREASGAIYNGGVSISKSITLLGERDATQTSVPLLAGQMQVSGLAANETFVLKNLSSYVILASSLRPAFSLGLANNAGQIHVDSLSLVGGYAAGPLSVSSCSHVSIVRSSGFDVSITDSECLLVECVALGSAFSCYPPYATAQPGINATRSSVTLVDTRVRGGAGSTGLCCWNYPTDGAPGVLAVDSRFTLSGGGTSLIGGTGGGFGCANSAGAGFVGTRSSLLVDPAVPLFYWYGSVAWTQATVPLTKSSPAAPGGAIQIDLRAPASAIAAIFVSLPGGPFPYPFGSLWLDPSFMILVEATIVGPAGTHTLTRPILSLYPRGLPLAFQSGILDNGLLSLTTPSITVLE